MKQVFVLVKYSNLATISEVLTPNDFKGRKEIVGVIPFDTFIDPKIDLSPFINIKYPIEYRHDYFMEPPTIDRFNLTINSDAVLLLEAYDWQINNLIPEEEQITQPEVNILP
jgi:hypothetical protein